jgi:catechol 2,3-dioxygenase-like lactoylglutathione lyase family enzyme
MRGLLIFALLIAGVADAQERSDVSRSELAPVPELAYRVVPDFFQLPAGMNFGEAAGVAVNSKGHIFLFQRAKPMLVEFGRGGKFVRSLGDGLFDHPHGLRIDRDDNIWTVDDGNHLVLKLNPDGRVLLVLGRRNMAGEADWLFSSPADVAFGKSGEVYVADGYGNSRVMKFDRTGSFLKSWGTYGSGPGEFRLPHSIVTDEEGRVYVADRENMRVQIFDSDGKFLTQWKGIGYPYGLFITPDQRILMADGGYDRVIELDREGRIVGAFGEPGRAPGQFAWAHFLAVGPDRTIYVADVLNWRFQVFVPESRVKRTADYVPTTRRFWGSVPSAGWLSRQSRGTAGSQDAGAMSFDHAALRVSNLERSRSFYESLGLKKIADPFNDDRHMWLGIGSHQLHLLAGGSENPKADMSVHLAIRVPSIKALAARLDELKIVYYNSRREARTITARPDGVHQIYLQDPDGYWLEFNDAAR